MGDWYDPVSTLNIKLEIKTGWYRWRNREVDQLNREQNTEIQPHKCSQLTFDKRVYNGEKQSLQQTMLQQIEIHM